MFFLRKPAFFSPGFAIKVNYGQLLFLLVQWYNCDLSPANRPVKRLFYGQNYGIYDVNTANCGKKKEILKMSIRWVKNIVIDGTKSMIEVQIGDRRIGDKCYTRLNTETESWFTNRSDNREDIIAQGIDILRKRLEGKQVTYPDGRQFDWSY